MQELVAAKADMMDKVTKNDEEAIQALVQEKVTLSGISLPENIEVRSSSIFMIIVALKSRYPRSLLFFSSLFLFLLPFL